MRRPRRLPKVLSGSESASVRAQFNTRYPTRLRNLCLGRLVREAGLRVGGGTAHQAARNPGWSRELDRDGGSKVGPAHKDGSPAWI